MKTDKKRTGSGLWMGSIIAALIAAISIFVVMLQMEKKVLSEYEKGFIYMAAVEIPKGEFITDKNIDKYLKVVELDVKLIPETALTSSEQLNGLVAATTIEEGVFLTEGMFEQENVITKEMDHPVIAGFKAEDIYQVVGGVLRAGDRIHIYTVSESGIAGLIWKDVFVQQVFDSSGNLIVAGNTTSAAQRINVYFDAKDVERFYTELARGTLRVVKVCENK